MFAKPQTISPNLQVHVEAFLLHPRYIYHFEDKLFEKTQVNLLFIDL